MRTSCRSSAERKKHWQCAQRRCCTKNSVSPLLNCPAAIYIATVMSAGISKSEGGLQELQAEQEGGFGGCAQEQIGQTQQCCGTSEVVRQSFVMDVVASNVKNYASYPAALFCV